MSSTNPLTTAVVSTNLEDHGFKLLARGKVRDVYEIDDKTLLFVATDRISAYDVIMKNGIPEKGALLTALSSFWFRHLSTQIPNLRTHFVSSDLPPAITAASPTLSPAQISSLSNRSMTVKRLSIFPIEAIVRGYITGSAWAEYTRSGTIHGEAAPAGLRESQQLPAPIYTPSTKAEVGGKDENITRAAAAALVGDRAAARIEELALALYNAAAAHGRRHGIVIADTKFEFGFDPRDPDREVVLVDEVLTPDSSRFWPADAYEVGKGQASFDKQFLRDWLTKNGLKGKEDVAMPEELVQGTRERYVEAYERLTGEKWKGGAA
ncbi:mitochondrial carrier protein rim2 [Neofusicoccum parvum]|uniref:Phosphoribosylaminoimidazole-succinocarboxamide synthase n=3 Tax=Neofusicoccum TaxID=407951 RepID=A0A343JZP5_9PEZI|nr:SAICAR synthetase [Neofusicoccum cordaticola]ATA58110.1 SAICAR synthetase [Neofusicoccum kwambonambiense]ATA58124.1 SAICAR synthetase [Neofusicoccum umdonicola]GME66502.1 mitochondrial carrier protein rim2 [Neofusicoccum parvum]